MNPLNIAYMNWNQLRWFYLLSGSSSLSQAAHQLRISQSCLSRCVMHLEALVGTKLMKRGRNGIELLQEGKDLRDAIATFFQAFASYESRRQQEKKDIEGIIRLSIAPVLPVSYLTQELSSFLDQYPGIRFHLLPPEQSREADCWIQPYDASQEDALIQKPLIRLHYGLYAASSYLSRHGPVENLKDLHAHKLLVLRTTSGFLWGFPKDLQEVEVTFHEFTMSQDVLWAAKQGLGIAALPKCQAEEDSDLVALSLPDQGPVLDLYYAYPKQKQCLRRITAYGDFLIERVNKERRPLKASKLSLKKNLQEKRDHAGFTYS